MFKSSDKIGVPFWSWPTTTEFLKLTKSPLELINLGAYLEVITLDGDCVGYPENGHTALSIAIFSGNYDMVKLLIEKGANIKHKSYSEFYDNGDYKTGNIISKIETMLELAERYKNKNIINLLNKTR